MHFLAENALFFVSCMHAWGLIHLHKLIGITDGGEVVHKLLLGDDDRSGAVIRMETQARRLLQVNVQKQNHVVLPIVDQPKGRDGTGFET